MSARILAVADVYDVLTSERPYKAPLSKDAARERLLLGAGISFDPLIVQVFIHLLDTTPGFTLPQRLYVIPPVAPHKTGQLPPPGSLTAGSSGRSKRSFRRHSVARDAPNSIATGESTPIPFDPLEDTMLAYDLACGKTGPSRQTSFRPECASILQVKQAPLPQTSGCKTTL